MLFSLPFWYLDIPAALPRFVHLSLALPAGALGVASLPPSGLNRERAHTDRWRACLVAALAGAVVVAPVKLGLTALLAAVTGA
ncbi:hypothetical protein [Crossiella sp. CA198]|uniref:hypothetical protein n=1 Tax=Crossiella sp. CA198 TaxID=3455607 RepID=UPI003F8D0DA9